MLSAETVRELGKVAGTLTFSPGVVEEPQQRIIPALSFTCNGSVSKWIFAGKTISNRNGSLQLQIWRKQSTGNGDPTAAPSSGVYERINSVDVNITTEGDSGVYSVVTGSSNFSIGDVLGIFEPDNSQTELYYISGDTHGPINYVVNTHTSPTVFSTSGQFTYQQNTVPLITAEIGMFNDIAILLSVKQVIYYS